MLYVSNIEENTTEDQVQEYVRRRSMKAGVSQPKLHNCKVHRREEGELGKWAARITVNEAFAEYLCNRIFWCGRVYARPWIFREDARARLPSGQQSTPNNGMPNLKRPGGQQLPCQTNDNYSPNSALRHDVEPKIDRFINSPITAPQKIFFTKHIHQKFIP